MESGRGVFIAVDSSVERNAKKRSRGECAADESSWMRSHTKVKEEDVCSALSSGPSANTCLSLDESWQRKGGRDDWRGSATQAIPDTGVSQDGNVNHDVPGSSCDFSSAPSDPSAITGLSQDESWEQKWGEDDWRASATHANVHTGESQDGNWNYDVPGSLSASCSADGRNMWSSAWAANDWSGSGGREHDSSRTRKSLAQSSDQEYHGVASADHYCHDDRRQLARWTRPRDSEGERCPPALDPDDRRWHWGQRRRLKHFRF